jgi:RNA polymerase sigma-70 factor, ECF subfamily
VLRSAVAAATVITTNGGEKLLSSGHSAEFTEEVAGLVREARSGNRAAFGSLYQLYAGMVHGILLARVPRLEVDDLVQEVFLSAMRQLSGLRDAAAFGAWLAAIARNRANDFHRRVKDMQPPEQESPIEQFHVNDSAHAEAREALAAIRQLPEAYRETLVLRLVEGMTGPEIALRTGLTPDSVRVNLHRGMKMLRETLRKGGRP